MPEEEARGWERRLVDRIPLDNRLGSERNAVRRKLLQKQYGPRPLGGYVSSGAFLASLASLAGPVELIPAVATLPFLVGPAVLLFPLARRSTELTKVLQAEPEAGLHFLAFHARRFAGLAASHVDDLQALWWDRLENSPTKAPRRRRRRAQRALGRKIQSDLRRELDWIRSVAEPVAAANDFRDASAVLAHLGSPAKLIATVADYHRRLWEHIDTCDEAHFITDGDTSLELEEKWLEVGNRIDTICARTDSRILVDVARLATAPGTGRQVNRLVRLMRRLASVPGDDAMVQARRLAEIVNAVRNFPLSALADIDLTDWPPPDGEIPDFSKERRAARELMTEVFAGLMADLAQRQGRRLRLLTVGHSEAVAKAVARAQEYVAELSVVTAKTPNHVEASLMEEALEASRVPCVTLTDGDLVRPGVSADACVIGFEALTTRGELLHPREIGAVVRALDPAISQIIAVGESWKVREFEIWTYSRNFAEFGDRSLSYVVTDCKAHKPSGDGTFHLACCMGTWRRTGRTPLVAVPPPAG